MLQQLYCYGFIITLFGSAFTFAYVNAYSPRILESLLKTSREIPLWAFPVIAAIFWPVLWFNLAREFSK
jgi:hypothetical protein